MNTLKSATTAQLVAELISRGAIAAECGKPYDRYAVYERYSNSRAPIQGTVVIINDELMLCKTSRQE